MSQIDEQVYPKINIQNFFDPSLFWFIYFNDIQAKENLHKNIQRYMNKKKVIYSKPKGNSIVAVEHKNEWYRARIIKEIELNDKVFYLVHFIDEGFFERVKQVYCLTQQFIETPAFSKRGMLYAVQSTRLTLDFGDNNINRTGEWSAGIINNLQNVLADPNTIIRFEKKLVYTQSEIGNLYIYNKNAGHNGCLTNYLVKKKCAVVDERSFKSELLINNSEDAYVNRVMMKFEFNQKRQRSKSVNFREPKSEIIPGKTCTELRNRSNSEARELTFKTIRNEREHILEKAGIQTSRQSRISKFLSENRCRPKTKRILNDSNNGVEIPTRLHSGSEKPKKRLSPSKIDQLDDIISESSFKRKDKSFESSDSEIYSDTKEVEVKNEKFATNKTVRGRGFKKERSLDTSSDSNENNITKSNFSSARLTKLIQKKHTDINNLPDSNLQVTVNVNNSERNVTVKPNSYNAKSVSARFGKLMALNKPKTDNIEPTTINLSDNNQIISEKFDKTEKKNSSASEEENKNYLDCKNDLSKKFTENKSYSEQSFNTNEILTVAPLIETKTSLRSYDSFSIPHKNLKSSTPVAEHKNENQKIESISNENFDNFKDTPTKTFSKGRGFRRLNSSDSDSDMTHVTLNKSFIKENSNNEEKNFSNENIQKQELISNENFDDYDEKKLPKTFSKSCSFRRLNSSDSDSDVSHLSLNKTENSKDESGVSSTNEKRSLFEELTNRRKLTSHCIPAGMGISTNSKKKSETNMNSRKKYQNSEISEDESLTSNNENSRKNPFLGKGYKTKNYPDSNSILSDSSISNCEVPPSNFRVNELQDEENIDDSTPKCRMSRLKTKHCLCDTCVEWRDTNNLINEPHTSKNIASKPKKHKKIRPLSPLLKTELNAKVIIERQVFKSAFDKFVTPKVLVHSTVILVPVMTVVQSSFHPDVRNSLLRLNYEKSHRIQAYTWSSIARGLNTVIVNGPKSGKSMSYIPPLCSEVLYDTSEQLGGPIVLIIVPGVLIGEHITSLICKMYYCSKYKPKIILAVPPLTKRNTLEIVKNVDILIVTPKILLTLLKEKYTRLKRIKAVVFEEAHSLFDLFSQEMDTFLQILNAISQRDALKDYIKLILVSKIWTPQIENVIKKMHRTPTICIGAHLEAALYGRININVKFVDVQSKDAYVHNLIEENKKVIIICNNDEEVHHLKEKLVVFKPLMLDDESDLDAQKSVQSIWDSPLRGDYRILLCNDYILNTAVFVNITDTDIAIQYSLPESWTMFSKRFSRFSNIYSSPIYAFEGTDNSNFTMHICLDENNQLQYEKIIKFLMRFNRNLPTEIIDLYHKLKEEKEKQKIIDGIDICDNLKLFGTCEETENCSLRHKLHKRDTMNDLPKSGIIKLKILHMHDITHYAVRLIEHIDSENRTHEIKDKFASIAIRIAKLNNEKNRQFENDIQIGKLCAVEESSIFRRAKITKILSTNSTNVPTKIQVKLLDVGEYINLTTANVYQLPDDLSSIPPQAVDVYISDVGPPDKDTNWSDTARIKLQHMLKQADYEEPNCYFTGRIKLQLSNTIWVNNLILREYAPDGSLQVHKLSAKSALLRTNLIEERPEQLERLYELCRQTAITLPDYSLPVIVPIKEIPHQIKPMWAHLENDEEYNLVYFCAADDPNQFFLRLSKNQSNLDNLIDDIQKAIRQPLYPTVFEVIKDRCYLAKDPQGDQYCRVIVKSIENDIALCFFVDHGDYTSVEITELKFLTDELITKLPFQVIECSLWGLMSENWSEKSIDKLYEFAYEPDSDLLRFLRVKVMDKSTSQVTGGTKYSVLLIDTNEETIINNVFVDFGNKVVDNFEDHVDFDKLKEQNDFDNDDMGDVDSDREYTLEVKEISKKCHSEKTNIETKDEEIEEIKRDNGEVFFDVQINDVHFDVKINDHIQFFKDAQKDSDTKPYISKNTNQNVASSSVPIQALPSPDYSTPNAVWYQTNKHVIIKIKLIGVTQYDLFITRNKFLLFSTKINDVFYKLNIPLYSKVESTTEDEAKGFFVFIKLKKLTEGDWEKLYSSKQKLRHISYDPEVIEEKKIVEEKVEIPFLFDEEDKPKYVYEYGSDFDYDESDPEANSESD